MVSRYAEYLAAVTQRDQFVLFIASVIWLTLITVAWLGRKYDRINQLKGAILVLGFYLSLFAWIALYFSLAD